MRPCVNAALLCVGLAGCALPYAKPAQLAVTRPRPAAPSHVTRTVWQPGAWRWQDGSYLWVPGHYTKRVVSTRRWVPGHYDGGVWVPGHAA